MKKRLKNALTVRGDSLYCPLSLSLDSYWNCLNDCWHCWLRKLNYVWGQDLRPADPEEVERKLVNGLKNRNPRTSLAWALKQKKTIRFGNKSDPFQKAERRHRVSQELIRILLDLDWEFVVQTMCSEILMDYSEDLVRSKEGWIFQPIISPGAEDDWEILERRRTTPIDLRFKHLSFFKKRGVRVAVNGEPFIPGYHTTKQFEDLVKRLKSGGIKNYNTYNFHFNDFVAKRLHSIGVDILKIWEYNQDRKWKSIQQKLIDICKKYDIILGCPDFVNSGKDYFQPTNTCCGIDVRNPTTFNTHHFKKAFQEGLSPDRILERCWDHIGDFEDGKAVLFGESEEMYTMKDAGFSVPRSKDDKVGFFL